MAVRRGAADTPVPAVLGGLEDISDTPVEVTGTGSTLTPIHRRTARRHHTTWYFREDIAAALVAHRAAVIAEVMSVSAAARMQRRERADAPGSPQP